MPAPRKSVKNVETASNHVTTKQWDDWVPQDRVRQLNEENKELAAQLQIQMKNLKKAAPKKGVAKANGSDFSSQRGSEERHTSAAAAGGRGPRRNRDYDLEHVSNTPNKIFLCVNALVCCFHCVHCLGPCGSLR